MQRLSSFSRAWTHVHYRAQSLLPCPFYHKSQSSEASNHKSTDEATIISLVAESASAQLLQLNHVLLLPLFYLMWEVDQLGKALPRETACQQTARTTSSKNKIPPPPSAQQNHLLFTNIDSIFFQIKIIEICIDSTQEQNQVVRLRVSTMCSQM